MSNLIVSEINYISLEKMIKLSRKEQNLTVGGVSEGGCIPPFKTPIIIITPAE